MARTHTRSVITNCGSSICLPEKVLNESVVIAHRGNKKEIAQRRRDKPIRVDQSITSIVILMNPFNILAIWPLVRKGEEISDGLSFGTRKVYQLKNGFEDSKSRYRTARFTFRLQDLKRGFRSDSCWTFRRPSWNRTSSSKVWWTAAGF